MKVNNILRPHECNGETVTVGDNRKVLIGSVWNNGQLVRISLTRQDEPSLEYVVRGDELIRAVTNALNRPWDGME